MSQALYRQWRPQTWDEVVGQEHVIQTLRNAVRGERVGHAYLFAGSRGTGKTSTARVLAKAVNCVDPDPARRPCNVCDHCKAITAGRYLDLIEIDAASNTSVEDVRDLRDKINFAPNEGRFKVYIIDEVHMLSTAAFNALLKTLEEPPAHAIFILATTEVHKIPATVLSRCQRHEFRRLPVTTIVGFLQSRIEQAQLHVEQAALQLIARQATGSLRDAISLLDQLSSMTEQVSLADAQAVFGTVASDAVVDVIQALAEADAGRGLTAINRAMDGGADPRQFARQVVDYLRDMLLIRMGNAQWVDAPQDVRAGMASQAQSFKLGHILAAMQAFTAAAAETRPAWIPGLTLELALLEALDADTSGSHVEPTTQAHTSNPSADSKSSDDRSNPKAALSQVSSTSAPIRDASPPEPSPQDASPGGQEAFSAFGKVRKHWRQILQVARSKDPRVQGLLNSCRPLGIEQGTLLIGFRSDLLREKMEKHENLSKACAALEEVLQEPINVRCVLLSGQQAADRGHAKSHPMEDDGMVATALRDLGAQVVDVKNARGGTE